MQLHVHHVTADSVALEIELGPGRGRLAVGVRPAAGQRPGEALLHLRWLDRPGAGPPLLDGHGREYLAHALLQLRDGGIEPGWQAPS